MPNNTNAQTYDCGDGVPDLVLATNGPATEELAIIDAVADEPTTVGAPLAFMVLTIVGQLAILLAVLAGGNALIGAAAGLALLVCALTVLGARTLRQAIFGQ